MITVFPPATCALPLTGTALHILLLNFPLTKYLSHTTAIVATAGSTIVGVATVILAE